MTMYKAFSPGAVGVKLPIEDCAPLAKKHGFEGIYIDARWAQQVGPEHALDVLGGLRPAGFGLPFDYRIDTAEFSGKVLELENIAAAAAAVGCNRCSTWIPSWHDRMPYDENFQFHRRRLQWIANVLAEQGVSFGLEFLGTKTLRDGHPYPFIHTLDELLSLFFETASDNLGVLLDSWHWYTSGGTVEQIRKLQSRQVVDVHINDAPAGVPLDKQLDGVRALPGETGVIDIAGFLGALKFIGYDGPVMAEPFSQKVREMAPEQAIAATAAAIDKVWPKA